MSHFLPKTANITKPQKKFRIPVDNTLNHFVPTITEKPNALTPLDTSPICSKKGKIIQGFRHPYEFEIDNFVLNVWQCTTSDPIVPKPLNQTDLIHIDTIERLQQFIDELKDEQEIAIDLEGHIRRSFQGFTCILQISTRSGDYIIDSLELRDDLIRLNEIFTDPKILKVFHGSASDITCLQRDFSVFVVNMFDTMEAAKYLKFETLSLQSLVKYFCNIDLDKRFQLKTDWRARPLSTEQICYARQDTHYLLYIHDILRNRLINCSQEELNIVYKKSGDLCKLIYLKPKQINGVSFCKRYEKMLNDQQMRVLRMLVVWRESNARDNDESLNYVMPLEIMLKMAKHLPKNTDQLFKCCEQFTPCTVFKNKEILVKMIQETT